jgi:hypothetical protein
METNSIRKLKLENLLDPRLACMEYAQKEMTWSILKGAEGQNFVQQQANSYSTAGVVWNFNTQSQDVIINRNMYAKMQFQVTFVGKAPVGQPLLNTEIDAPRAFPLASISNSLKVTINGKSVESQYDNCLQALLRYNLSDECLEHDLSQTPHVLDKSQRYVDLVGSVRNPLSSYANNSYETGRGAFQLDSLVNPVGVGTGAGDPSVNAVAVFTVCEPLFISPMLFKQGDLESGLIGVKNMGVQFTFNSGSLDRVWSHAGGNNVTFSSVTTSIGAGTTAPPQLLVNYLTPPLIDVQNNQIPRTINYQYYDLDTQVNDMNTTLAPLASQTFTNNSIQLSTVPKAIYIYACRPSSTKSYLTTDTFHRITSLSLNYLNVSGQFSSMTPNDLYNMSRKNGCNLSFQEWNGSTFDISSNTSYGLVGSVLKIDVSDLHIPSNVASGQNMNSQLSYSIGLQNVNRVDTIGVQLVTIMVYDGLITIDNYNMNTQIGVVNSKDILATRAEPGFLDYNITKNLYGGNMFADIGHLYTKPLSIVKKAVETGSKAKDAVDSAMELKRMVGLGLESNGRGGALVGGRQMTRRQLKAQMFD